MSVAYIFVHILPDLAEHQEALAEAAPLSFVEHHVYLVALVGLSAFYGLERLIKRDDEDGGRDRGVFWLHIASFTVYNALIGYLLVHRESPGLESLLYFFIALTLHFLVNDVGLCHDHKALYERWGRWILSAAVLLGWARGRAYRNKRGGAGGPFRLFGGRGHPQRAQRRAARGASEPLFGVCLGRSRVHGFVALVENHFFTNQI